MAGLITLLQANQVNALAVMADGRPDIKSDYPHIGRKVVQLRQRISKIYVNI